MGVYWCNYLIIQLHGPKSWSSQKYNTPQWSYSIFISNIVTGFKLYFPESQVFIWVFFVAHVCAPSNKEKSRCHWLSFHCFPESDQYLSNKSSPRPWTDYTVIVGHQRGMCVWGVGGTYSLFKEKLLSESWYSSDWSIKRSFKQQPGMYLIKFTYWIDFFFSSLLSHLYL